MLDAILLELVKTADADHHGRPCNSVRQPQIAHDLLALERDAHGLDRWVEQFAVFAKCLDRLLIVSALAGRVLHRPCAEVKVEPRLVPVLSLLRRIACRARCRRVMLAHDGPSSGPFSVYPRSRLRTDPQRRPACFWVAMPETTSRLLGYERRMSALIATADVTGVIDMM